MQHTRPGGGAEQASAINLASAAPSKMRGRAEAGECLRVRAASNPSSQGAGGSWRPYRCWYPAPPRFRRQPTQAPPRPHPPSADCAPSEASCRMFALPNQGVRFGPLVIAQPYDVFLQTMLFRGHQPSPSSRRHRFRDLRRRASSCEPRPTFAPKTSLRQRGN